jgi:hypothetical protein
MKRLFLLFAVQIGFLHAQSNEQYTTNDILLIYGQKSFAECALSMNANISLDEMSEFVNSACYTCFHAHKPDFEQDLRADLGRPNNGSPPEVIRAKHIKIFVDNVVDDLAVVARNFQGEDRDLFWTLSAKNVTQSMLGLLRGKKDEHGIEKHINRKINLKKLIG